MADLSAIINKKNEADEQWKAQKQAERDNASAMQDAAVVEVTQNPGFTKFATAERWRSLGRNVMPSEAGRGATIFARQTFGRGYTLAPVFDISQTTGRNISTPTLTDGTDQMEKALTTLLNFSVAPVVASPDLESPALYNEKEMTLYINPTYSDSEAFAAIAAEIAHCRIHAKGVNTAYNRAESDLDAKSAAYILCKRFGVKAEMPDIKNLAALYDGWEPMERRGALDQIHNMSQKIGNAIARRIEPPQRSRAASRAI